MEFDGSNSENPSTSRLPQEDFFAGAARRISWFMAGLGLTLIPMAWRLLGRASTLGFVAGSIIAILNFHWLKSGVAGLADRVTNSGSSQSAAGTIARFLLRYALIGIVAYGMLISFPRSLKGLFLGLFLPVGAIACEAGYETYLAFTRRN
jgi:hypothetical protein